MGQDVFSVFGIFGPGGMTTAILNRSSMLAGAGHHCRIVTLDYGLGASSQLGTSSAKTGLHPDVAVLNPFSEAREANTAERNTTPDPSSLALLEDGLFIQADEFDRKHYARYFLPDGNYCKYKKWSRDHSRLLSVDYFNQDKVRYRREEYDENGVMNREIGYVSGIRNRERYLTSDGFCYLVRWFDAESGKGQSVFRFNRGDQMVSRFPNLTAWRNSWLQGHLDACDGLPMVIADGRYVMPQLLELRKDSRRLFPVMHSNHYSEPPFAVGAPVKDYYSYYFDRIGEYDGIITLTSRQAMDVERETGDRGRIVSIPNSIDLKPAPSVNPVPGRVGMFGRIIRSKGHLDAIRAWPAILRANPKAELHIFGSAPTRADPYLQEIVDAIAELGLSDTVKLRGYSTDVAGEAAQCLLTILPSTTEGMPFAVVESMAAETPVVAYDCNYGPRDLIDEGVDGLIVPVGDTSALASGIIELLKKPRRTKSMGVAGRKKLARTFSAEETLGHWEKLLEPDSSTRR
ncbi:glycosyltransferase [Arthrobacter rhombi]|uniref:glycosyltransferase n=1 Tax=Arthrobacter rhombi TaxID=71253 RepID=UPI003FD2AF44